MSKRLNLQNYQEAILARLRSIQAGKSGGSTSRLGIETAGKFWLVNLEDVAEVVPPPDIKSTPLTRSWFMGLANIRGNLYAISNLAEFMGSQSSAKSAMNRILLAGASFGMNAALWVDQVHGLRSIVEMQPVDQSEEAAFFGEGQSYVDESGRVWTDLDLKMIFKHEDFMQVVV